MSVRISPDTGTAELLSTPRAHSQNRIINTLLGRRLCSFLHPISGPYLSSYFIYFLSLTVWITCSQSSSLLRCLLQLFLSVLHFRCLKDTVLDGVQTRHSLEFPHSTWYVLGWHLLWAGTHWFGPFLFQREQVLLHEVIEDAPGSKFLGMWCFIR